MRRKERVQTVDQVADPYRGFSGKQGLDPPPSKPELWFYAQPRGCSTPVSSLPLGIGTILCGVKDALQSFRPRPNPLSAPGERHSCNRLQAADTSQRQVLPAQKPRLAGGISRTLHTFSTSEKNENRRAFANTNNPV